MWKIILGKLKRIMFQAFINSDASSYHSSWSEELISHIKTAKFCKQEKSAYLWKIILGKLKRIMFQAFINSDASSYHSSWSEELISHIKTAKFCKQEKSAYLWKIIHGIELQSLIKKILFYPCDNQIS